MRIDSFGVWMETYEGEGDAHRAAMAASDYRTRVEVQYAVDDGVAGVARSLARRIG